MSIDKNTDFKLSFGQRYEAVISTNNKGLGFAKIYKYKEDFVPKSIGMNLEKIEIQNEFLATALPGDKALIEIIDKNKYGFQAKVIEILERKQDLYAGHIEKDGENFFFVSHDTKMYTDFFLSKENMNGAVEGDKVVASIFAWEDTKKMPKGKIEKVLGKKGDSSAEIAAYSEEKGFHIGFSKEIEEESKAIHERGIQEIDLEERRDFRKILTCTIDPADAKDFDDAISVVYLPGGDVEVGVHIADVSHYLQLGSAMDTEAQRRTTSVYLVDRVVPMLPEVLSNDLCSLVQGQDRLTMSAVFIISPRGEIKDRWFGKTVIHSDKRFSYEEAQEIIVSNDESLHWYKELTTLNNFAKDFSKKRKENGALSMETEEVKFKLDEKGVPVEVYRKVRFDAHKLVEEFMLLANVAVAQYVHNLGEEDHVGVYRVHDLPDSDKMLNLATFLYNMGYNAPFKDDTIAQKDLNRVMSEMENDINKATIQTQIVRSMQKAIYTTQNVGHYGLAFDYYSHFTSPIRRYPDVMIHRLMKKYLKGGTTDGREKAWTESMCLRSSEREKDAAEAERASIKYKQVEYMSYHIGEELTALVSGLSPFGIYLEDEHSKCEGMIKFKDISSEYFEFDDKKFVVKGEAGTIIRMGDVYKVKVIAADLEKKQIEYKIIEKIRSLEPRRA